MLAMKQLCSLIMHLMQLQIHILHSNKESSTCYLKYLFHNSGVF
jgi:hypothetical protein